MTATDNLRRMLDERGVEWWEEDGHTLWYGESIHHAASAFSSFLFGENERVHLNAMVTPEQAIEATLGRGECKLTHTRDKPRSKAPTLTCSECGWWTDRINDRINYCPSCGRAVRV